MDNENLNNDLDTAYSNTGYKKNGRQQRQRRGGIKEFLGNLNPKQFKLLLIVIGVLFLAIYFLFLSGGGEKTTAPTQTGELQAVDHRTPHQLEIDTLKTQWATEKAGYLQRITDLELENNNTQALSNIIFAYQLAYPHSEAIDSINEQIRFLNNTKDKAINTIRNQYRNLGQEALDGMIAAVESSTKGQLTELENAYNNLRSINPRYNGENIKKIRDLKAQAQAQAQRKAKQNAPAPINEAAQEEVLDIYLPKP